MKVYECKFCGDEFGSDAIPQTFEYDCVIKMDVKLCPFAIGDDFILTGDELEQAQQMGEVEYALDVVRKNRMEEVDMSKKMFMTWLKKFVARMAPEVAEADREAWKAGASKFAKFICGKHADLMFYAGSSVALDSSIGMVLMNADGLSGSMYVFKAALEEVKV